MIIAYKELNQLENTKYSRQETIYENVEEAEG